MRITRTLRVRGRNQKQLAASLTGLHVMGGAHMSTESCQGCASERTEPTTVQVGGAGGEHRLHRNSIIRRCSDAPWDFDVTAHFSSRLVV